MPLKHEVWTLEALAQKFAVQYTIRRIYETLYQTIYYSKYEQRYIFRNNKLKKFCYYIQKIQLNLSSYLHRCLYREVTAEITNTMKRIQQTINKYRNPSIYEVMGLALIEVIRILDVPKLDFTDMFFQRKMSFRIKNLTNLKVLVFEDDLDQCIIKSHLLQALTSMKHLQVLRLRYQCTDRIIFTLVQYCEKLTSLDVERSEAVTDRSIFELIKSKHLKEVEFSDTSVTKFGIAVLLLSCSSITNIGRNIQNESMLNVLNKMDKTKTLNLEEFYSWDTHQESLHLITKLCPKLKFFEGYYDRIIDPTILRGLHNLQKLTFHCLFSTSNIHCWRPDLLENVGKNLIDLYIDLPVISYEIIVSIGRACPKLKSLFFNLGHEFQDWKNSSEFSLHLFDNLEYLSTTCLHIRHRPDIPQCFVEFMLSSCHNIKYVVFGKVSNDVTDDTMENVFCRNSMSKLKTVWIDGSEQLSMKTVNLFMKVCTKLKKLYGLEKFDTISYEQLCDLSKYIIENNINLDLNTPIMTSKIYTRIFL